MYLTSGQYRQLKTPVLFLVFNRPAMTARVFEAIRQAKPPRLYVAADGPREGREGEVKRCEQVRKIATAVDWHCEVKTLFRDKNLGCKYAVSSAITWFFEQEEQGLILEDDCLPHPDFFSFCQELLNKYADDDRVMAITGDNFQNGQKRGSASYYFSRFNHVWGWASWRRAWHYYDVELSFWPSWRDTSDWQTYWPDSVARRYWQSTFDHVAEGEIDTWDYQWTAAIWRLGGLTATPNVNLVSNIGFGPDSTHTASADSPLAAMETQALGEILHPAQVCQDVEADRHVFDHTFGGKHYRLPWFLIRLPRRVGGFVYRRLKQNFF
jgi:hypothetical protein